MILGKRDGEISYLPLTVEEDGDEGGPEELCILTPGIKHKRLENASRGCKHKKSHIFPPANL